MEEERRMDAPHTGAEEEQKEQLEQAEPQAPVMEAVASATGVPAKTVVLYKNKKRRRKTVGRGACAGLCLLMLCLGILFTSLYYSEKYADLEDIQRAMEIVESEYYFYDENTRQNMITGAIKGISAYIDDKYADYYTQEEYAALLQTDSGNYVGMGISVQQEDVGEFYIRSIFPNTPAAEAGLLVGDRLLFANGQSAEGMELNAFLEYFTHEEGDENTVVVERDGAQLSFTVTMREVYQPFVEYRMLEGNIGYICITQFHGTADEEVKNALKELEAQGMEKLVLDLRDDPGGSLDVVCGVAELFLPKDSLITTIRNRKGLELTFYTEEEGDDIPMTVLINSASASASELLSGALKDHDRATLFGTTTYGKGIVQTFYNIRGGKGGTFKLTTDAYYTPNDICIHGTGIVPDYEVELPEDVAYYGVYDIPYEQDTQLQAAVEYLKGH